MTAPVHHTVNSDDKYQCNEVLKTTLLIIPHIKGVNTHTFGCPTAL